MEHTKIHIKLDVILTVHHQYVEIKCQLDATEVFIADQFNSIQFISCSVDPKGVLTHRI